MHTALQQRIFMHFIYGRESQNKEKSLLAWRIIYCSFNNLSNKANAREAGESE